MKGPAQTNGEAPASDGDKVSVPYFSTGTNIYFTKIIEK